MRASQPFLQPAYRSSCLVPIGAPPTRAGRPAGNGRRIAPRPEERVTRRGLDLASQVSYFLQDRGETRPVPILGGFVAEPQPGGRVRIAWRLPGPALFGARRRRRHLRRYERLLRSWGLATELDLDTPEPYLTCWIADSVDDRASRGGDPAGNRISSPRTSSGDRRRVSFLSIGAGRPALSSAPPRR